MPPARTTINGARHWAAAWSASLQHGIQKCKNIGMCVVVAVWCVYVCVWGGGEKKREKNSRMSDLTEKKRPT